MRNRFPGLALLLCLGLGTVIAIPSGAAEPVDAKKIAKLIEQLGGDEFSEREKASAELDAIGAPALEALRKAAKNTDVEVSKRSADLVVKIEKRGETARLLAPKKVHLVYKETPLNEAIADFTKKSGYPINVVDAEGKLKDRKITLDTGEVTFWQAFDQFCEKAGLVEADATQGFANPGGIRIRPLPIRPLPPVEIQPEKEEKKPANPRPEPRQPQGKLNQAALAQPVVAPVQEAVPAVAPVQVIGRAVAVPVGPGGFGVNANVANQIILVDGKPKAMPADYASAIRVKVMEDATALGRSSDKEILIGLKVTAEPKIQIQQILNVRVEKALDDQAQSLVQAMLAPADPNVPVALPAIARFGPIFGGLSQVTPVRLKKGEKASKSLKELTGVISAQVLAPATPAITVEKIMDAAGKEFKGVEGGKIKIVEVTKNANGQITVRFELETPPNIFPANGIGGPLNNPWGGPGGIQILPVPLPAPVPDKVPGAKFQVEPPAQVVPVQIQAQVQVEIRPAIVVVGPGGVAAGPAMLPNQGNGVTLEDEKGNAIQVVGFQQQFRRDAKGIIREQVMVFQPQKDQTPSKLVFSGSKSVAIEIPFTLKNVMLP